MVYCKNYEKEGAIQIFGLLGQHESKNQYINKKMGQLFKKFEILLKVAVIKLHAGHA